MRKVWIASAAFAFAALSIGTLFADVIERPSSGPVVARRTGEARYFTGNETLAPASPYTGPYSLGSPGDTVSMTYYDLQANVNPNKHIACDNSAGVHFTVMFADDPSISTRHQYYNYYTTSGGMAHTNLGVQIDGRPRAGYGTIAVLSDGRAVCIYHGGIPASPDHYVTWVGRDLIAGMGIFQEIAVDTGQFSGGDQAIWPTGTTHWENDYVELGTVFATDAGGGLATPDSLVYNCSTDQADTWLGAWPTMYPDYPATQEIVGSTFFPGGLVLHGWRELHDQPTDSITDIVYRESTDYGATWGAPQSVTGAQHGDTLMVWDDFDACYDAAGEPHFVYALLRHLGGLSFNAHSILYHWSPSQGQTEIARAYWDANPVVPNPASSYDFGAIQYPSIGINPADGYLYVVWTQFADLQGPNPDTSQAGISNGEVYLSWSLDNGLTWAPDSNLTNSPSPNGGIGQCDDDRHSNIALLVNDTLHVIYQNDKWAGQQIVQGVNPPTNNPILYIHTKAPTGVEEVVVGSTPSNYYLAQNRPNPFGAGGTIIQFSIFNSQLPISLRVYDVGGRLVSTLVDGRQSSGVHTAVWDGRDSAGNPVPSGVYFYRLRAGDFESLRKMVLVR